METTQNTNTEPRSEPPATNPGDGTSASAALAPRHDDRPRLVLLVRHGQTTFNQEGRLPGQLPGVPLTDEGRRQAQRAAVALSGLPLSAVISSPLERARDTAHIIARGWALSVRLDPRLMDIEVGRWSGQKLDELHRTDPEWRAFAEHPNQPPPGVESYLQVQSRAVPVIEEMRRDASLGQYIVVVAHADVIKLILAHYTGLESERARFMWIANASISALALPPEGEPHLLALNWTALPEWLSPLAPAPKEQARQEQAAASDGSAAADSDALSSR